jgi:hypothetical protein
MEMLQGKNESIPPSKIFSCMCFVKNNGLIVGKLDLRTVKYIFLGYSGTQNGYVCWSQGQNQKRSVGDARVKKIRY